MAVAEMIVKIGADISELRKGLENVRRGLETTLGPEAMGLSRGLVAGFAGVSAALAGIGLAGVKAAADMEQTRMAFTTMLGSADQANAFLSDLQAFSAKTPFEFPGLADASKKLLAFGFDANSIIPMMTAVGDAAAGLGLGADGIDRMTLAIGQMKAKGKASAQEMMQLAEAGVPAWKYLADAIGTDIPTAMKMAEKGAIDADTAINGILQGMSGQFGGMMEQQAGTLLGMWSNLKDSVGVVLRNIGDSIIETFDLKTKLAGVVDWLTNFAKLVQEVGIKEALNQLIPPELRPALAAIAGAIMAGMVPALATMAINAWLALAPLLPLMAAGAALAAVAYLIYSNWEPISGFFRDTWTSLVTWLTDTWNGIKETAANIWNGIKDFFAKWWETLLVVFTGPIGIIALLVIKNWDKIKETTSEVWNAVTEFISGIWESISAKATEVFTAVSDFLHGVWEDVKSFLGGIWDGIATAFDNTFGDMVRSAFDFGKRIMQALKDAIGSVKIPIPSISLSFREGPLGIQIPDLDFGVSWRALKDLVPFLAEGGIVTAPTLAMIGEAGPEAVVPLDRGLSLAGAGGINITLNVYGSVGVKDIAEQLVNEIRLRTGIRNM